MSRLCTTTLRFLVPVALYSACGATILDWKSRPPTPSSTSWHCLSTGRGSFCEKTFDACRAAHRYVSQRMVAVKATTDDCHPAPAVYCTTYALRPSHPPETRELRSVREPGVDGWVYDCAATQATCEKNQERVVSDRASASEPTDDVSPCERWGG